MVADVLANLPPDLLLSTPEFAQILGVHVSWLNGARSRGFGPPVVSLGPRMIRYHTGKSLEWVRSLIRYPDAERNKAVDHG